MKRRTLLGYGAGLAAVATPVIQTGAQAAPAQTPARTLVVEAVQMPAWTTRAGQRVPLVPGAAVSTDHEVETAAGAAIALRLPEGSLIRLGEATRLGIQRFEVNEADGRTAVQSELKVFDGFFRFATSAVARIAGQRKIDVSLRTATIGIRGTDFWAMTDAEHDAACLFEGKVDLATRDQGALTLDKPTAFWARFFNQPAKPVGNATPDELDKFLASTELQPGKGVAVQGGRWRVVAAAPASEAVAKALARRLQAQGYPAVIRTREVAGKTVHEVRLNQLATRVDAQAVLDRIASVEGVSGRVALSA